MGDARGTGRWTGEVLLVCARRAFGGTSTRSSLELLEGVGGVGGVR